jgi:hypothetical protein
MLEGKILWQGKSGREYEYGTYPIGTSFKQVRGNYIFSKKTSSGYWVPLYIGQTKNLDQRLENHEKEACAESNGATHIHVHINTEDEKARLDEEQDLILRWQPPCND